MTNSSSVPTSPELHKEVVAFIFFGDIFISVWFNLISLEYPLKFVYIHTHRYMDTYQKYHWHFQEASRHSHSSRRTNISVWAHPTSSREQHSHNILGIFLSVREEGIHKQHKTSKTYMSLSTLLCSWHRSFQEYFKMVLHYIQKFSSPNTIVVANNHFLNMHCNWIHKC